MQLHIVLVAAAEHKQTVQVRDDFRSVPGNRRCILIVVIVAAPCGRGGGGGEVGPSEGTKAGTGDEVDRPGEKVACLG